MCQYLDNCSFVGGVADGTTRNVRVSDDVCMVTVIVYGIPTVEFYHRTGKKEFTSADVVDQQKPKYRVVN